MQKTQLAVSMEQECPSVPVAQDLEEIDTLFGDIEELESVQEGLKAVDQKLAETDVPEYDNHIHAMVYASLESYLTRIGLEDLLTEAQLVISTEDEEGGNIKSGYQKIPQGPKKRKLTAAYQVGHQTTEDLYGFAKGTAKAAKSGADKVRNTEAYAKAKELTKKALDAVSKKIRDATEKALKKFTDSVTQLGGYGDKLVHQADQALDVVKGLDQQPDQGEVVIHGAHKLQYRGKVDPKSVVSGVTSLHTLLDKTTGAYKETLFKELKDLVNAFMGDGAEKEFSHLQNPEDIKAAHKEIGEAFEKRAADALDKALGDIPDGSLVSGDYRIIARKKITHENILTVFTPKRPFLSDENAKPVDSKQTTEIADKKQLQTLVEDIRGIGEILRDRADDLINNYKSYQKELKQQYEAQAKDKVKEDDHPVMSWVVNKNGGDKILKTLKWYHRPITEAMRHAHSVSRTALSYVDKQSSIYP